MSFLNNSYTILPFLYFSKIQPGSRLLVVTDHPERLQLNFDFFRLSVAFCVPRGYEEKIGQSAGSQFNISTISNLLLTVNKFDLILLDLEHAQGDITLAQLRNILSPEGAIINLDWTVSKQQTFRNLPWHLGWRKRESGKIQDSLYRMRRAGLKPDWYFLVEPDLNKPRYMVPPAFATSIPALSDSPLKRWLIGKGYFYLQPHQRVIIASPKNSGSLVGNVITRLLNMSGAKTDAPAVIKRIYISTTNVLMVQAVDKDKNYYIRFPFTDHSIERIENQEELVTLLNTKGINFVPKPIKLENNPDVPYYIEEGIRGINVENRFGTMNREEMLGYYRQALEKIREIHQRFGREFIMQEGEFKKYIGIKLDAITSKLYQDERVYTAMSRIGEFLLCELQKKTMLVSICHGDLKIGNCLFDRKGKITGIIDWDMGNRDELALVDASSILAKSIRMRYRLGRLPKLLFKAETIPHDFIPEYRRYFEETKTSFIPLFTSLLFYWVDRVYKQITFNTQLKEDWITSNIYPVVENIDSVLQKASLLEEVET